LAIALALGLGECRAQPLDPKVKKEFTEAAAAFSMEWGARPTVEIRQRNAPKRVQCLQSLKPSHPAIQKAQDRFGTIADMYTAAWKLLTPDEDLKELARKPRLIAESRSGDNVPGLFEHKLVEAAVVSRFQFPSPGPEKPRTPEEWFVKRYQVITPDDAAQLSRTE